MEADLAEIDAVVHTIVDAVHPRKILLFGSAARGELHDESDLDLLVVMADGARRHETARLIRKRLLLLHREIDVIVATENELAEVGGNFSLVYYPALREGRVVYAA